MLTNELLVFLKQLKKNNNRDWFQKNKKTYEKNVKEPFEAFVAQLIENVAKFDPLIDLPAKKAIFRIYRDTRFSKDKTPYKTHISAAFSPNGRKEANDPGYYFHLDASRLMIGGGAYFIDKEGLQALRQHMAEDIPTFQKLYRGKRFANLFDTIQGEANKRIPKEFKTAFEKEPLIANKQFYFMAELPAKMILEKDAMKTILKHYKTGFAFNQYLREAFGKS